MDNFVFLRSRQPFDAEGLEQGTFVEPRLFENPLGEAHIAVPVMSLLEMGEFYQRHYQVNEFHVDQYKVFDMGITYWLIKDKRGTVLGYFFRIFEDDNDVIEQILSQIPPKKQVRIVQRVGQGRFQVPETEIPQRTACPFYLNGNELIRDDRLGGGVFVEPRYNDNRTQNQFHAVRVTSLAPVAIHYQAQFDLNYIDVHLLRIPGGDIWHLVGSDKAMVGYFIQNGTGDMSVEMIAQRLTTFYGPRMYVTETTEFQPAPAKAAA